MKGTAHVLIGAAAGAGICLYQDTSLLTIAIGATVGAVAGVIPDLDTNGLASNAVTLSKKKVKTPLFLMGIGVMFYAVFQLFSGSADTSFAKQAGIGAGMLILSMIMTQKRMLTITGAGVVMAGVALDWTWLLLFGIYVIIASFLPHRSYTHSLLGLLFFAVIAKMAQADLNLDGIYLAGITGYASHLIADMKILPMNRRGVKIFAPVWNKEF